MSNPGSVSAGGGFNYEALLKGLESKDQAEVDAALSQLNQIDEKVFDGLSDEARLELAEALERLRERGMEAEVGSVEARVAEAAGKKLFQVDKGQAYKNLPPELKQRVIAHLDTKTQEALAQTSKTEYQQVRENQKYNTKAYTVPENKRAELAEDPKKLEEILERFPNLEKLDLSDCSLGMEHFELLKKYGGKLTDLNLSAALRTADAKEACMEFLRSEAAANLTSLNLAWNRIGRARARVLAGSENLQNLTSLNLGYNLIGRAGAEAIAESKNLQNLTSLNLKDNGIGTAGAETIARSKNLQSLTSLNLRGGQIGADGARAIAESKTLKGLTSLNLGVNGIDDAVAVFAESETLQNLTSLNLHGNKIGPAGAIALAKALAKTETFQNLTSLDLDGNEIGSSTARVVSEAFREVLPGCKVVFYKEDRYLKWQL